MAVEVCVRKWGNSFGVVFPKDFVHDSNLKLNDRVVLEVVKVADLGTAFGKLKTAESGQRFKDRARKGWD